MNNEYAYCGMFTEQWRNPPKSFNPESRPYANKLFCVTTATLEAEGAYENFTLKERQGLDLWRKMYDLLKPLFEEKYQNSLN